MTPLSEIDELTKILQHLQAMTQDTATSNVPDWDGLKVGPIMWKHREAAEQAISNLFLKEYEKIEAEVIGEDENPMNHPVAMEIISAENNLRATQRQALERLKERWSKTSA